ncbi:hypothetical protein ACFLV7_15755 [Chloroflexota bacterium]
MKSTNAASGMQRTHALASKERLLEYLLTSLAKCMAITQGSKEHCLVEWMRQAKNAASLRAEIATSQARMLAPRNDKSLVPRIPPGVPSSCSLSQICQARVFRAEYANEHPCQSLPFKSHAFYE